MNAGTDAVTAALGTATPGTGLGASPQGSLMLYTTGHCKPAPDRLTSHCATVHSQHFQLD
jgi:hypothetical protein